MIATRIESNTAEEILKIESVANLVHATGPCVTLLLPPYRPGASGEAPATLLKTLLREAENKLTARNVPETEIADLLEPLRQLSHEEDSLSGSGFPRVIFRSPGLLHQFELPVAPPDARVCVVGGCFWLRPILNSLALPGHVYVLEINKEAVELLTCGFTGVATADLPKGTPKTMDEALQLDAPDHDLRDRSASGPSTGAMTGVSFGTGTGREDHRVYLRDFYLAVNRGINELLRWNQAPLILAGVDEDVVVYRSINSYPRLLEQSIHGSPGGSMTTSQVLRNAHEIALADIQQRASRELADSRERLGPARLSIHLAQILQAAVEGRVSDLYLDENAERIGDFDGRMFGGATNWHAEELLNVAAVETLLRSGFVYSLPTHMMGDPSVAVAAFRY